MADETQPETTQPAPEPAQEPAPAAPAPPVEDPATVGAPAETAPQTDPPPAPSSAPGEPPADTGSSTELPVETAPGISVGNVETRHVDAEGNVIEPASTGLASPPGRGPVTNPVTVNNYTQRSDSDALEGGWVDVVDGPYAGRYGAYVQTTAHSDESGFPETILVRTRDARNELIPVEYAHVRPSERSGGR